ncbi:MAG TPA: cyanophycin synthetase [Flavobacterium sp.]|jgi:cyanophycin synthetase
MDIQKLQILRGPNIWSIEKKNLVQLRLDLNTAGELIQGSVSAIDFAAELVPSLKQQTPSATLPELVMNIALSLQQASGMDVAFGMTKPTITPGIYQVVFEYIDEKAGIYAAQAAVRIAHASISNEAYDISSDIRELKRKCEYNCLGPSTQSIVDEAVKRDIPWIRLSDDSTIQLGYGKCQRRFQATTTCMTSSMAANTASNKEKTKQLLEDSYLPIAAGGSCYTEAGLQDIIDDIGYPIVIKPHNGNHGKGVTVNINTWEDAVLGLATAKEFGRRVIVERYVTGNDFRVLVINNRFVAATKRVPANVTGDGSSTIEALISHVNTDSRRGNGHEKTLTKIKIDRETIELLLKKGYTPDSIPAKGEIVYVKSTANLSTGGSAIDVTDEVHPLNIAMAETAAGVIGLDICGIDIMAENLSQPLLETGGVILEINAAPGFRMHLAPSEGQPRNVAKPVVDMLFPPEKASRIPIISITGTNGKTTTTRLLAHIVKQSGYRTGYTTTDGIYIDDVLHKKGDTTGPASAGYILRNPTVEFAVLESARGGLLRSGLGFDKCDVGVITNIKEDHLGLSDIETLEDLAHVKSVIVRSVKKSGWAVLNADDAHCMRIAETLECNVAFFSLDPQSEFMQRMVAEGRTSAVPEDGFITIRSGGETIRIESVSNIPLTLGGKLKFMTANALAASLAAFLSGITTDRISLGLRSFIADYEHAPGRMNIFDLGKINILVDYAHNAHGAAAIEEYVRETAAPRKIGIISGVGDRRDEDIREFGTIAGRMFDHVIIRSKQNLRGNTQENINKLLLEGLYSGGRNLTYEFMGEETEAVRHAIDIAEEGDFVIALTDQIPAVVAIIREYQERTERDHDYSKSA